MSDLFLSLFSLGCTITSGVRCRLPLPFVPRVVQSKKISPQFHIDGKCAFQTRLNCPQLCRAAAYLFTARRYCAPLCSSLFIFHFLRFPLLCCFCRRRCAAPPQPLSRFTPSHPRSVLPSKGEKDAFGGERLPLFHTSLRAALPRADARFAFRHALLVFCRFHSSELPIPFPRVSFTP